MDKQNKGNSNYFNAKEYGKDVLSILQKFTRELGRKFYFAHNQVIIFGKDLAKEGVRDSFDFFARSNVPRMTVYIFVAKEKREISSTHNPASEKYPPRKFPH